MSAIIRAVAVNRQSLNCGYPEFASNLRGGKPLSLKLLKSSVRDRGPKTPCKIPQFLMPLTCKSRQ